MMDLVTIDGRARGIVCRNLVTGELERYSGHAVVLATGGYGNVYFLSTNAMGSNVTAAWRAYKSGARALPTLPLCRSIPPASRSTATTSPS
jgi:succinate dehydrogenase / fumarate reductase, flavoprotein subunit